MLKILKKIYTLFKSGLTYALYNIVYIKKNFKIKEGKYAIVNIDKQLKDDDLSRYFYIICMYLNNASYKVIVKADWREFKTFKKPYDFKRLLLKQSVIFVSNCSASVNTIVLMEPQTANHIIHLSYGYHITKSGKFNCVANYPMYPVQYKFYKAPAFTSGVKKSNRNLKIFFAGDINEIKYGKEQIRKYFDVIPRLEVINFILSNIWKSRKLENESGKSLLKQWLNSTDYVNEVIISEVKTKEEDWLKILSKTDFFICPPGVRIPWSHNCVEAMSAGAIPILEYAELFYPKLENMKNCLSYTNYSELQMAIEKALAMEPSEIENMRKNVFNYYNDYLSIDSITKEIKTFGNSAQKELKVAIPFIPTKQEWAAQIALYNPGFLKQIGLSRYRSSASPKP